MKRLSKLIGVLVLIGISSIIEAKDNGVQERSATCAPSAHKPETDTTAETVRSEIECQFNQWIPHLYSEVYKVREQAHRELLKIVLTPDRKRDQAIRIILLSHLGCEDVEVETRLRALQKRFALKDFEGTVRHWRKIFDQALPPKISADFVYRPEPIQKVKKAFGDVLKSARASSKPRGAFQMAELFLESGLRFQQYGAKDRLLYGKAVKDFEAALTWFERSRKLKEVDESLLDKQEQRAAMLLYGSRKWMTLNLGGC